MQAIIVYLPLSFHLLSLTPQTDSSLLEQPGHVLMIGFHEHWPDSWADHEEAMKESTN